MKTTDCSTLEKLIENHEPVTLIDVRSKKEFAAVHIAGARSCPLPELTQPRLFRRTRPIAERVYVISNDRGIASLATGILRASGEVDAIVVDGGMKAWIAQGLPVRRGFLRQLPTLIPAGTVLPVLTAAVALLRHELLISTFSLLVAAVLVLKAKFFAGIQIAGKRFTSSSASRSTFEMAQGLSAQ